MDRCSLLLLSLIHSYHYRLWTHTMHSWFVTSDQWPVSHTISVCERLNLAGSIVALFCPSRIVYSDSSPTLKTFRKKTNIIISKYRCVHHTAPYKMFILCIGKLQYQKDYCGKGSSPFDVVIHNHSLNSLLFDSWPQFSYALCKFPISWWFVFIELAMEICHENISSDRGTFQDNWKSKGHDRKLHRSAKWIFEVLPIQFLLRRPSVFTCTVVVPYFKWVALRDTLCN